MCRLCVEYFSWAQWISLSGFPDPEAGPRPPPCAAGRRPRTWCRACSGRIARAGQGRRAGLLRPRWLRGSSCHCLSFIAFTYSERLLLNFMSEKNITDSVARAASRPYFGSAVDRGSNARGRSRSALCSISRASAGSLPLTQANTPTDSVAVTSQYRVT